MTSTIRWSARVISISTRAAAGMYTDTTGPWLVDRLTEGGYAVGPADLVPDGQPVSWALRSAVADRVDVVLTTGGTGINPRDQTPEYTRTVLDTELPGVAEAIRAYGIGQGVPTAALSRGLAGVAQKTLIVNLPGSSGGVRDGWAVLRELLPHALDQLHGGDHRRTDAPAVAHADHADHAEPAVGAPRS